jgi:hypothetical protein
VDAVVNEFEVGRSQAQQDVERFMTEMLEKGVLVAGEPG